MKAVSVSFQDEAKAPWFKGSLVGDWVLSFQSMTMVISMSRQWLSDFLAHKGSVVIQPLMDSKSSFKNVFPSLRLD